MIALANEGVRNENTLLCGGDCRRPSNFCHWLCAEWIAGSDLNFHLFSFATINIENLDLTPFSAEGRGSTQPNRRLHPSATERERARLEQRWRPLWASRSRKAGTLVFQKGRR